MWNRIGLEQEGLLRKQFLSVKIDIKSSVPQVLKWPSTLLWCLSSSSSSLTPSGVQVRPVYWPVKLRNTMNWYWSCWQCGQEPRLIRILLSFFSRRMKAVSPLRCSGEGRLELSVWASTLPPDSGILICCSSGASRVPLDVLAVSSAQTLLILFLVDSRIVMVVSRPWVHLSSPCSPLLLNPLHVLEWSSILSRFLFSVASAPFSTTVVVSEGSWMQLRSLGSDPLVQGLQDLSDQQSSPWW